jgi:hypothetical protein
MGPLIFMVYLYSTLVGINTDCVSQDDRGDRDWKLMMSAFLNIVINGFM